MKLSEVIRQAMPLAKAMSDYWEAELPRRFKKFPFEQEGEDRGPMPPEQVQLKANAREIRRAALRKPAVCGTKHGGALRRAARLI